MPQCPENGDTAMTEISQLHNLISLYKDKMKSKAGNLRKTLNTFYNDVDLRRNSQLYFLLSELEQYLKISAKSDNLA